MKPICQIVSLSSHMQSCSIKNSSLKKEPQKNGILPKRKFTNHITPHQKAILIHQFNIGSKKIKNIAKDLKINYSTAKTIIQNYRKHKSEFSKQDKEGQPAKRCSFRQNSEKNNGNDINGSIISMIGGKVTNVYPEKLYRQVFCSFKNAESYVEKFLLVKEIEQELKNFNYIYLMELERDKAIVWFQQKTAKFHENHVKSS